jgi:hypothetical protein
LQNPEFTRAGFRNLEFNPNLSKKIISLISELLSNFRAAKIQKNHELANWRVGELASGELANW